MNITIPVMGTRGDVQPLVALGKGLKAAGHTITIATHQEFEPLVSQTGLRFYLLRGIDPKQAVQQVTGEAPQYSIHQNPILQIGKLAKLVLKDIPVIGESCWEACQEADLCLATLVSPGIHSSVSEKLGIPYIYVSLQPAEPTSEFPNMLVTTHSLGSIGNRLTYSIIVRVMWAVVRSHVNKWRQRRFALPPLTWKYFLDIFSSSVPRLYGFSPNVIHRPIDWSEHAVITGYWFLNQMTEWQPPQALVKFLESGSPPISIGFGSMVAHDKVKLANLCIQALSRTQQRGILVTGWGGLQYDDLPESILAIESVPHEWLFPRVSAVVHHGGAGTTAATLRAGVPTIVVPFLTDQPFWGKRVFDLGVGPPPIPRRKLTVDRLSEAITEAITNPDIKQYSAELGRKIRAEDGIGNAINVIHQFMKEDDAKF